LGVRETSDDRTCVWEDSVMTSTTRGITVETSSGVVRGFADGSTYVFRGIPYGRVARFQAPLAPERWTGVRDALSDGPACPQPNAAHPVAQAEECLNLNVWTSGLGDGGARPVLVWLHGGGYHAGSASMMAEYDGGNLSRRGDVVVVSLNQRVGVLGYLYLGQSGDDRFARSGNAATLDLVAALHWVAEHAEAFGGDPGAITIFGASGGAAKVTTLLAVSSAEGVFSRAISQSGVDLFDATIDDAVETADRVLAELGIRVAEASRMLELPVERIVEAAVRVSRSPVPGADFTPVVDGLVLHRHPLEAVAAGASAGVPLIIGTTRDEATPLLTLDEKTGQLDLGDRWDTLPTVLGDQLVAVVETYRQTRRGASDTDLYVAIATDRLRVPVARFAEAKAAGGPAPVFVYETAFPYPAAGGIYRARHGLDSALVLDTTEHDPAMADSPAAKALSARMANAWLAFAATGDPATADLPQWPPYDAQRRATMVFDETCSVESDLRGDERRAWDDVDLHGAGLLSRTPVPSR
jgi:para-nitrobenzyl esterase